MNKVYLLIGGNMGDREKHLNQATMLIKDEIGEIMNMSSIYETAAWGIEDQPPFLNAVIEVITTLSPHNLLHKLLSIEEGLGRKRIAKFGPRTIDLDILLYNNEIISEPDLKIPHPALPDRRFALIPLNELAPNLLHPVFNKTIMQLLNECKDALPVLKYRA